MSYRLMTLNTFSKFIGFILSVKQTKQIFGLLGMFFILFCHSARADNVKVEEGSAGQIDSLLKKVELIPIMINGDKDNRINIVLMNRWSSGDKEPYNSQGMRDEFINDINESLIAALTPGDERAQTAFASYREFFNVYGLWYPETPEWNKGINGDMVDALRDRLFLPWKDSHTGWVTFLVMPNRDSGGGGAARNLEKRVGTALIAGNGIGKMLHEIAHTCMSIGDEYTAEGSGTSAIPTYTVEKEYRRDKIKWRKWIEPDTPLPTPYKKEYLNVVGAFEGAQYHLTNYFRSTAQGCIMGAGIFDNTEKMCPVCEQRVAMRVNTLVNPIVSFAPEKAVVEISGKTNLHFKMNYLKPIPNTQIVRWILNGKIIETGPDEIDIELGDLNEYELICTLTDETPFIRPDPPFASYPKRAIKWKIINSIPESNAKPLNAEIVRTTDTRGLLNLESRISGGTPPYHLNWSNGSCEKDLNNVGPGIYHLNVFDSEYRNSSSVHMINFSEIQPVIRTGKYSNYHQGKKIKIKADMTAPEKGKQNGKIFLKTEGGKPPYSYVWSDEIPIYGEGYIYEAENAELKIPGHSLMKYDLAGNQSYISFEGNEGSIKWVIEIVRAGIYPVDFIYGGISAEVTPMEFSVNDIRESYPLMFNATRPLFTGWDQLTVMCEFKEGKNTIEIYSDGNSGVNFDYLRVPCTYSSEKISGSERWNLSPGDYSVTVTDQNNSTTQKSFTLNEVYPVKINSIEFKKTASGAVAVKDPLEGYEYNWYRNDIPLFIDEQYEMPLCSGVEFFPPAPGNYYVSVKDKLTHAESMNRVCIGVGKIEVDKKVEAINPGIFERKIILWFDSSDLDGDGNQDMVTPERGPLKEWKAKTWRNPGKIFAKYKPNVLNGMGVCGFDNVWISKLGIDSLSFQTVILVYRESSMSQDNTSPFRELNRYIGKSADTGKQFFDPEKTDEAIINGKVYLNSINIDPFATPNPMEFCMLTVEFDSEVKEGISIVDGNWEGDIAEMIFIKGLLTEAERQGVEEYLRKKWFSAYDLEFKKIDANVRL